MEITEHPYISTFAQIVDKLRNKNEEELKLLYVKFFSNELISEWENFTMDADFTNVSEEDFIKTIQKNGYKD
ncbi:MAG: hypothetical protein ABI208_09780 [Ginsengibacter sp.]